jgi:hypothetical protein
MIKNKLKGKRYDVVGCLRLFVDDRDRDRYRAVMERGRLVCLERQVTTVF